MSNKGEAPCLLFLCDLFHWRAGRAGGRPLRHARPRERISMRINLVRTCVNKDARCVRCGPSRHKPRTSNGDVGE